MYYIHADHLYMLHALLLLLLCMLIVSEQLNTINCHGSIQSRNTSYDTQANQLLSK